MELRQNVSGRCGLTLAKKKWPDYQISGTDTIFEFIFFSNRSIPKRTNTHKHGLRPPTLELYCTKDMEAMVMITAKKETKKHRAQLKSGLIVSVCLEGGRKWHALRNCCALPISVSVGPCLLDRALCILSFFF